MASIQEYLDLIKNAIYGKDVRQAIHDGIQQCYYDGKAGSTDLEARQRLDSAEGSISSLGSRMSTAENDIDVLDSRVDQIVAPSGEAPSAAEVSDARVGADGVTHTSLGDAIRDQVENLQNAIDSSNRGLEILKGKFENGGIQNGQLVNQPYRVRSVSPIVYDRPITLYVNDGYRIALSYYSDPETYVSDQGWKTTGFTIPANQYFKAMIAITGSESWVTVDVPLFVNQVHIDTEAADKVDDLVSEVSEIEEQQNYNIFNYRNGLEKIKGTFVNAGMSGGQLVPAQTYRVTSSDILAYDRIIRVTVKDSDHRIAIDLLDENDTYIGTRYVAYGGNDYVAKNQRFRLSIISTGSEQWGTYADIDEFVNAVGISSIFSSVIDHNVLSPFNKPFMGSSRIKIAQHRGWHDETTIFQNTNKAFEAAGKKQAWAIETDIWETTDNHFVIMHDQDVSTTTDGQGNINEMTLAQVEALTITADPTEHVPTLEEYLGICKLYGCVPLIEIKGIQGTTDSIERLLNVLNRFGLAENSMIIAPVFILDYIRTITLDIPVVVVVTVSNYQTVLSSMLKFANIGLGFDSAGIVTSTIVEDCHDRGYLVNVWTTESVESAIGYYSLGVDFITSDKLSTSDFLV